MRAFLWLLSGFLLAPASSHAVVLVVESPNTELKANLLTENILVVAYMGWEHLTVQPVYSIAGNTQTRRGEGDSRAALVVAIPVPARPVSAHITSDSALVETWNTFSRQAGEAPDLADTDVAGGRRSVSSGYPWREALDRVDYSVSVITAQELARGKTISNRKIAADMPPDYMSEGFWWVVIRITGRGREPLPATGVLQPVTISFPTQDLYLPLRASRNNQAHHVTLFTLTQHPAHVADASAFGLLPLQVDSVRGRMDRLLWQGNVSNASRAVAWYASERDYASRPGSSQPDANAEQSGILLARISRQWRWPVINAKTLMAGLFEGSDPVQSVLADALRANQGDAPRSLASFCAEEAAHCSVRAADSLYASVFCAVGVNFPGSEMDLSNWQDDPVVRQRRDMAPLAPPRSVFPITQPVGLYSEPSASWLPGVLTPRAIEDSLMLAQSPTEARHFARLLVQLTGVSPRVYLPRQIEGRHLGKLVESLLVGPQMPALPTDTQPYGDTRSLEAFERAVRPATPLLQAFWGVAGSRQPKGVVLVLGVAASGRVDTVEVRSALAATAAPTWFVRALPLLVHLPPADAPGQWAFPVVIAPN